MKPFLISILFFSSITNYSLASTDFLEKFNGKFKCSTNNQEIPTCLDINVETNAVHMVGCGFNQSKEFEIILKNPTSLIIGSNQSIVLDNLSSFKKPSYTFIYVLTDLWKNDEEVGKEFKFEQIEIKQEDILLNENETMICSKF